MVRARTLYAKIDSSKGAHMQRAKAVKEDLEELAQEADSQGIPAKLFKKLVKTQQARAKAEAEIAKLDEEDLELYEMIEDALAQTEFDWAGGDAAAADSEPADEPAPSKGKGKKAAAVDDEHAGQTDLEDAVKGAAK